MTDDWDGRFHEIVDGLVNLKQLTDLTREDLVRTIAGMNEVAMLLGKILMDFDDEDEIPIELTHHVREVMESTNELAEFLTECDDPECDCNIYFCPDCSEYELCEDCIEDLEEDL